MRKDFKLSENIGNIGIAPILHSPIIMPVICNNDEQIRYYAFPDVFCKSEDETVICDEVLTPDEAYWLHLFLTDNMRYIALSDEPMCDRIADIVETLSHCKIRGITNNPLSMQCANGNKIIFRGVNDDRQREKLKSITFATGKLTDVWIEEATELAKQDLEIIDDRLRGELPQGLFYQIKMTFNPVSASHWIKRDFFDREDDDVFTHHSTYLDNRFCDDAYKRRMLRRKELDSEGYRIYGLGEWGEIGGLILHNWKTDNISQNPADYDDFAIGQDFGFNHANAILLLGIKDDNIYITNEIYVYEKDTSEIIQLAKDVPKTKRMWCDSAEPDRIKMWKSAGYRAKGVNKGGSKGSVKAQIDWLKQRKIYVHPSCVNTIKELQQWKWQKDERENDKYLDEPVPIFDDAMAALRYGVEGWRKITSWVV